MSDLEEVLQFWFEDIEPRQWWVKDPEFDALVARKFEAQVLRAAHGELFEWRGSANGRLAEILLLDQFSRNIFRDTPGAFAQDPVAVVLTQEAISSGALDELREPERAFLLMPFMHSESALIHQHAEPLFKAYTAAGNYDFERRHKAIIDRFGRYPHRNAILGRQSTPQEIAFLNEPGSSF